MLNALKNLFTEICAGEVAGSAATEQRQLRLAVAGMLHEMTRVDLKQGPEEAHTAVAALAKMFAISDREAQALLDDAGSQRMTSYFDLENPVTTVMGAAPYPLDASSRPLRLLRP